jgi:hypothetical protein
MTDLLRYKVELLLAGVWTDITTSVRHTAPITTTRGSLDETPKATPAKAKLRLGNNDDRFNPRNPTGPYYGKLIRNTPIRISCTGVVGDTFRFYGEVFAFEPRWTEGRHDSYVDITPSGALRRVIGNRVKPHSYYRAWWNNRGVTNPVPRYFYPLEDAAGTAEIGQGSATFKTAPADAAAWGKAPMNDWLPNGVAIDNFNELTFPCDMRGSSATAWEVSFLMTFPDANAVSTGVIDCGTIKYGWNIGTQDVIDPNNPFGQAIIYVLTAASTDFLELTALPPLKDVGPVWVTIRNSFNGTVVTTWASWQPVSKESNAITVSAVLANRPTAALEMPRTVTAAAVLDATGAAKGYVGLSALSVSECSNGTSGIGLSYAATKGNPGELTYDRFAAICAEQGINASASSLGGVAMGRRYIQSFEDHLAEILASSAHSGIVESRTANELRLLSPGTHRGSIAYTEIIPDLQPVEDDQTTANIMTYTNSHGLQATIRKATGAMSVAEIGPFEGKLETNNAYPSQGLALAGQRLIEGTWTGPRFREFKVSARANPGQYALYRSIDVGDMFSLTGMAPAGYFDTSVWKVLCIEESLTHEDHVFTFTAKPGEPSYRAWQIGTSRIDLATSTVAVGGSGATIDVNVPAAKWLTTATPFDIMISGERLTVTAVANLTSTTQRLTVTRAVNGVTKSAPVGAEVHIYPPFYLKAV